MEEERTMRRGFGPLLAGIALSTLCWSGSVAAQTIVVGGKAFTEQQIMTAMTVALLKAKGFAPERKAGMGSAAVRAALENGQIDVYWEYTGTGLGVFNKITDKFASAEDAYKRIKEVDGAKGIVWLNMSPVVRKEILDKNPKLADALNSVSAKLNDEIMAKLNASVDVDKKTPEEVAEAFLKVNG